MNGEQMTFAGQLARDRYIREQRAYGWEVFLSYVGTSGSLELYSITRIRLNSNHTRTNQVLNNRG